MKEYKGPHADIFKSLYEGNTPDLTGALQAFNDKIDGLDLSPLEKTTLRSFALRGALPGQSFREQSAYASQIDNTLLMSAAYQAGIKQFSGIPKDKDNFKKYVEYVEKLAEDYSKSIAGKKHDLLEGL